MLSFGSRGARCVDSQWQRRVLINSGEWFMLKTWSRLSVSNRKRRREKTHRFVVPHLHHRDHHQHVSLSPTSTTAIITNSITTTAIIINSVATTTSNNNNITTTPLYVVHTTTNNLDHKRRSRIADSELTASARHHRTLHTGWFVNRVQVFLCVSTGVSTHLGAPTLLGDRRGDRRARATASLTVSEAR
jgi:hypothetical protein